MGVVCDACGDADELSSQPLAAEATASQALLESLNVSEPGAEMLDFGERWG
jgi:hypothetical protein